MQTVRHVLLAATVLAGAWTIGATIKRAAPVNAAHCETATLAGGCFWGLQEKLRQIPGVVKTTVGYTGGTTANPTYEQVVSGKTGHVEAVEVVFDPAKLSYEELLSKAMTAAPGRLTIFCGNEAQRITAEQVKHKMNVSGRQTVPVVAEIKPATTFYPAEEYHQDYYRKTTAQHRCEIEKK